VDRGKSSASVCSGCSGHDRNVENTADIMAVNVMAVNVMQEVDWQTTVACAVICAYAMNKSGNHQFYQTESRFV
jgi:hypothetical protein